MPEGAAMSVFRTPVVFVTAERLRELLSYDPLTGELRWRVATGRRVCIGQIAGSRIPATAGYYWQVQIDGVRYSAHRLAFFYMTGKWPGLYIDHRDGNPSNNRWANLREATASHNIANSRRRRDNKSGFKGVHKSRKGWRSDIEVRRKHICLGTFDTPEEAHAAYVATAIKFFGEFARFS
jgi:hypothetical protein